MSDIEARKRALVTQCEIYREALKADIHELQLYGASFFKKIDRLRSFGPWLMLAAPVVLSLLGMFRGKSASPKPSKLKGRLATALMAFRIYRKYAPMVRSMANHFIARRRTSTQREPAER